MEMDISPAVVWVAAISSFLGLGTTIWNMLTSGSKQNSKKLDELEKKFVAQDRRLQTIEAEIKHLPDQEASHRLEMLVERLNGRIETLDERLKPVAAISERMQELLLEQAKNR